MLNKYPAWKYILILFTLGLGILYSLPNLYPDDFAIQVTGTQSTVVPDEALDNQVQLYLSDAGISLKGTELGQKNLLIRLSTSEDQLAAKAVLQNKLGDNYIAALNMAQTTPEWLKNLGAGPMKLGLDLRGGVHFLLEVDTAKALAQRLDVYASEIKIKLREEKIRYRGVTVEEDQSLLLKFSNEEARSESSSFIRGEYLEFQRRDEEQGKYFYTRLILSDAKIKEISEYSKRKQEISIDLKEEKIFFGNKEIKFEIDSFKKKCLLEGLDDIALSLEKSGKISSFEKSLKNKKPWIFND